MEEKIKFAPAVILIDATYLNKVVADMRVHFSQVLNRELSQADLARLLECIGLDSGMRGTDNAIQVIFIYNAELPKFTDCIPADFNNELHNVAFKGNLGEFSIYSFQPSDMASCEDLFIESLQLVGVCKDTKRIVAIPDEMSYGNKLDTYIKDMKGKDQVTVFGMNPPAKTELYDFQILGFAILQALGIKPDEL